MEGRVWSEQVAAEVNLFEVVAEFGDGQCLEPYRAELSEAATVGFVWRSLPMAQKMSRTRGECVDIASL